MYAKIIVCIIQTTILVTVPVLTTPCTLGLTASNNTESQDIMCIEAHVTHHRRVWSSLNTPTG